MKLIIPSILICLALFAGYHVALKKLPAPLQSGGSAGSQPERNLMRAQNYYYAKSDPQVVIVGSSISERLLNLPANWYPLTFPGGNAFTGMEIILRSGKRPRYVLIETNVLNLDPDDRMLDSLTYPVLKDARNKLPALLERSKPSHVVVRVLERDRTSASSEPVSPDFFDGLVKRRMGELAKPLPPERLDVIASRLKHYVTALEKRGAQVIFFEMPEVAGADRQPLKVSIRDRVRAEFAAPRYRWVPTEDATSYRTTDAVHLDRTGAMRYCGVLSGFMGTIDPATSPGRAVGIAHAPTTAPSSDASSEQTTRVE